MIDTTATVTNENSDSEAVPAFGYELIREILLPEILGKDAPDILYWAGKRIARKFPLTTLEEIVTFFYEAGWGDLTLLNESKNELRFELSSSLITNRLKNKENHHFQLEAGFLAEQFEVQKEMVCETFEHPRKKAGKVQFTVKWDIKDFID